MVKNTRGHHKYIINQQLLTRLSGSCRHAQLQEDQQVDLREASVCGTGKAKLILNVTLFISNYFT